LNFRVFLINFNKSLISNECAKLVYSLNNKPISTLNVFGTTYTDLNFTYDLIGDGQNEDGYVFIKSNNINDTYYTYFYETVNATINYKKNNDIWINSTRKKSIKNIRTSTNKNYLRYFFTTFQENKENRFRLIW